MPQYADGKTVAKRMLGFLALTMAASATGTFSGLNLIEYKKDHALDTVPVTRKSDRLYTVEDARHFNPRNLGSYLLMSRDPYEAHEVRKGDNVYAYLQNEQSTIEFIDSKTAVTWKAHITEPYPDTIKNMVLKR